MRRLRRSGGVVLVSLALVAMVVVAGCGPAIATPSGAATSPSDAPIASSSASADDGSSPGSTASGSARLAATFRTLAKGYLFDTTVTIAGQVATHAAGRWLSGRSEFVVESGGTALTYRSIPPRSWVFQDGTGWVELADKAASGDPLDPLSHPSAVAVASDGADALVLEATYPPKTLGVAGTAPVTVELSISPDGRTTATYTVATDSGPATTVTILSSGSGLVPITVPSPAA